MNCELDWSMQRRAHDRGRRLIASVERVYYRPQRGGLHTAGEVWYLRLPCCITRCYETYLAVVLMPTCLFSRLDFFNSYWLRRDKIAHVPNFIKTHIFAILHAASFFSYFIWSAFSSLAFSDSVFLASRLLSDLIGRRCWL